MTSRTTRPRTVAALATTAAACLAMALPSPAAQANPAARAARPAAAPTVADYQGLSGSQRADLMQIAEKTWKFFGDDVDPKTHLPLDNLTYAGGS
ncbi:MAG: hypothetical protein ACXVXG_01915, partial [Nocardioidaceae bacterium]